MRVTGPSHLIPLDFEVLIILMKGTELLILHIGYEVLTAVVLKSSIFRDITPGSPLKVNPRFGVSRLFLQGRRIIAELCVLPAGFLHGLFFDPEDGGNMCPPKRRLIFYI
jgi:hypothetical protein